ncbi:MULTISPECIES: histidine phosphatase family protein [Nostoc]|jgi:probable phosphoglycerate mutase|uniref:Histidine phosphatase family protein n=1 Tax=Nostoc punctiforme FACHB-252 TaxID=1357509 RepID=A0ABR8HHU6_NOSPU|nr:MULTISPECIES: histidine phosphatase family protein [Nostoc]MBC1241291.1 histidine phosphatase family protein [Nostoc sp. 2RC]MBD2615420.1 histidine phosphatase family protein [Nostoc punctiforme FACHB-252]MDZ8014317.1 histidine phosphatase family protein [Nostoc sp. ZfuVER08]
MTRVIIVRHGQSSYNTERRIQGRTDASTLTEKGRNDASKLGKALSNLSFNAIYSSPLQRAKHTADIIHSELTSSAGESAVVQVSDWLLEIDLPLWEGMLTAEVKQKLAEDYRTWHERPHELRMLLNDAQGTREHFPVLALYEQARQFWQEILSQHQGETILIVGHNGINRALISTALGISPSRYHSVQQSNCGISVLNFAGGLGEPVQLESLNQTQHTGETLPSLRPEHQGVRLLLVRHGETDWNRQTRFQGQIDVPLNDNGRQQSQKAGEFLQKVAIAYAVSSPMLRPKETAEIILKHHPSVKLDLQSGLREISHGLWEGKLETEIEQEFPGELQRWRLVPAEVQMPEGENLQQVWERSVAAWQSIVETALTNQFKTILVVAHDATNKTLLCHILGLPLENFWNFRQGNGAVSVIDYPSGLDGLPALQAMNITTHLGGGVLDKTAAGAL